MVSYKGRKLRGVTDAIFVFTLPMGIIVRPYPRGTRGLRPTDSWVMSLRLAYTLDEVHSFQKPYGIKRITHQA